MKLPQLSLRELFLLVALVAMGCGWWVDHRKRAQRERLLVSEKSEQLTLFHRLLNDLRLAEIRGKAAEQEASRLSSLILAREDKERRLRRKQAEGETNRNATDDADTEPVLENPYKPRRK
jgi:hypothetical protein